MISQPYQRDTVIAVVTLTPQTPIVWSLCIKQMLLKGCESWPLPSCPFRPMRTEPLGTKQKQTRPHPSRGCCSIPSVPLKRAASSFMYNHYGETLSTLGASPGSSYHLPKPGSFIPPQSLAWFSWLVSCLSSRSSPRHHKTYHLGFCAPLVYFVTALTLMAYLPAFIPLVLIILSYLYFTYLTCHHPPPV